MTSVAIATNEVAVDIRAAGDAPDWIMVIPAGEFSGRDGRGPYKVDPEEVIEATAALGFEVGLPIDYDHATDFAAPSGGRAPAAGWMTELQNRDGAIWAHVEWTDKGREAVSSKEYRYISPVFAYDDKTGEVLSLLRAGLTNNPNLYDIAICSRPTADSLAIEDKTMAIEIEKYDERRRKIEAITFPPPISPTFGVAVDPFASINASIAKRKNAAHATSRGKFLPDAPREDFDDRGTVESSSIRAAHDLLACHLAGEDGSCRHGKVDHVAAATETLNNFAKDEAGRASRRKDAGRHVASVRFAS